MEEIKTDDYQITYNPANSTVTWSGSLRLREAEYEPITTLLVSAAGAKAAELTLDLRRLQFLNSGGINVLSRFLIQLRSQPAGAITVQANQAHPWQLKTLRNLQRLMRGVKMDILWS
jgi:hypothetical protein